MKSLKIIDPIAEHAKVLADIEASRSRLCIWFPHTKNGIADLHEEFKRIIDKTTFKETSLYFEQQTKKFEAEINALRQANGICYYFTRTNKDHLSL